MRQFARVGSPALSSSTPTCTPTARKQGTEKVTVIWQDYQALQCTEQVPTCHASVLQDGNTFTHSLHPHIHPADPTAAVKAWVTAKVKQTAADKHNIFTPASTLVEQALVEEDPAACFPAPGNITRAANRVQRNNHPDKLWTWFRTVDYITDDFRVKHIWSDSARRDICSPSPPRSAVTRQYRYLTGLFKTTRERFHQLFTLHAFVKGDCDNIKQVSLAYVYITRWHKKNSKKVLKAIKRTLLAERCVEKFIMDYEWAMWDAASSVFLNTTHQCCYFISAKQSDAKCRTLDLLSLPKQWWHPGSSSPAHGPPLSAHWACPKALPGPAEPNTKGPLPGPAQLLPLSNWLPRDWTVWASCKDQNWLRFFIDK